MTATASLTLTGSVAALAAALQAFDAVNGGTAIQPPRHAPEIVGNSLPEMPTASINTGTGIPAQTLTPSEPSGVASIPTVPMPTTLPVSTTTPADPTGEDEDGEASDGTGVDVEGLPWDARIHSSSKKKTAKGLWVAVRNGPKGAELAAIKDELRGVTQIPMPVVSEPMQQAAVPVPNAAVVSHVEPVVMQPVPVPMPAVSEPQVVTAPPALIPMPAVSEPVPVAVPLPHPAMEPLTPAVEWDFAKLMGVLGPKIGTVITTEYLVQVCQKYGLNAVTDTAQKPEAIPQLIAQFQTDGVW